MNPGKPITWFVEEKSVACFHGNMILVDTCRFSCGRWLAKNMDDGSTERLLVAELMKIKGTEEGLCILRTLAKIFQVRRL